MANVFKSISYDMSLFGIDEIKSAILTCDKDSGVSIELSFDGGSTFRVYAINEKFDIDESSGAIIVRVLFDTTSNGLYTIKTSGSYPMLSIGTSLYFEDLRGATFQTGIGQNGSYSIDLPDGSYSIWYNDGSQKVMLNTFFMPRYQSDKSEPLAKESMVECFLRDLPWAKYAIFDVYENLDKVSSTNAQLDIYGNLIDPQTNKVCRWWAIGFTDE